MNHGTKVSALKPQDRPQSYAEGEAGGKRWGDLATEASNPATEGLDTLSSDEIVGLLIEEDQRGLEAVRSNRADIARAASWLAEALQAGRSAVLVGAGTSGRLGILEAAECPPTFGTEPEQIRAVIAGGPEAVFKAREGAEDVFEDGAVAAENLRAGDLLIGLSASSATPFVKGALASARQAGAGTILVTCAPLGSLSEVADLVIALDTGSEILTGSTRLKAGSATKAALNAITTAAMVRLGKVYKNLMVDLRPGSDKLVDRAARIVQAACGISRNEADDLMLKAGGEVKTAIVMQLCGIGVEASRERLAATEGHVRQALADGPGGGDGGCR